MRIRIQFFALLVSASLGMVSGFGLSRWSSASTTDPSRYQELKTALINFHVMDDPGVLRGGRPSSEGILALARAHVKTVVDLQGGDQGGPGIPILGPLIGLLVPSIEGGESKASRALEKRLVTEAGMTFVGKSLNSMRDITEQEINKIDAVLAIMHDPARQPVYIHCAHGNDRTGMISALYRVRHDGMSPIEAHDEMIRMGHKGFIDHIVTHEMDAFFWKRAPEYQALYQREHARSSASGF